MAPHSNTVAQKIPWTEEPGRLQSMGSHRVGHDWSDLAVGVVETYCNFVKQTLVSLEPFCQSSVKWKPRQLPFLGLGAQKIPQGRKCKMKTVRNKMEKKNASLKCREWFCLVKLTTHICDVATLLLAPYYRNASMCVYPETYTNVYCSIILIKKKNENNWNIRI